MNAMPRVDIKVAVASSTMNREPIRSSGSPEQSFSSAFSEAMQASEARADASPPETAAANEKVPDKKSKSKSATSESEAPAEGESGQNLPDKPVSEAAIIAAAALVSANAQQPVDAAGALSALEKVALDTQGAVQQMSALAQTVVAAPDAAANIAAVARPGMAPVTDPGVLPVATSAQNPAQVAQGVALAEGGIQKQVVSVQQSAAALGGDELRGGAGSEGGATVALSIQQLGEGVAQDSASAMAAVSAQAVMGTAARSTLTAEASVAPRVAFETAPGALDASADKAPSFGEQGLMNLFSVVPDAVVVKNSNSGQVDAVEGLIPRLGLPAETASTSDVESADFGAADSSSDFSGGLSISQQQMAQFVKAPASPAASAPAAPVMVVAASQVNNEIVKFAGAGGGRAVMEITSPDLGALKIDLSIDGRGSARMIVEATTGAARDQLEQGLRRLSEDFAGMGLSLNIDLRQGGGSSAWQEPQAAWQQTGASWGGRGAMSGQTMSAAPQENARGRDDSQVNFYA